MHVLDCCKLRKSYPKCEVYATLYTILDGHVVSSICGVAMCFLQKHKTALWQCLITTTYVSIRCKNILLKYLTRLAVFIVSKENKSRIEII